MDEKERESEGGRLRGDVFKEGEEDRESASFDLTCEITERIAVKKSWRRGIWGELGKSDRRGREGSQEGRKKKERKE